MLIIILQAWTALRHAFYETFLHIHIALVSVVLAASWVHLDGFPQLIYIKAVVSIWVIEVSKIYNCKALESVRLTVFSVVSASSLSFTVMSAAEVQLQ